MFVQQMITNPNSIVTLRGYSFRTATECFVKVNRYPFLYQVDLEGEIDTNESTGVVDKTGVHFHLIKVVSNTQSTYCYLNLRTLQSGHQLIK